MCVCQRGASWSFLGVLPLVLSKVLSGGIYTNQGRSQREVRELNRKREAGIPARLVAKGKGRGYHYTRCRGTPSPCGQCVSCSQATGLFLLDFKLCWTISVQQGISEQNPFDVNTDRILAENYEFQNNLNELNNLVYSLNDLSHLIQTAENEDLRLLPRSVNANRKNKTSNIHINKFILRAHRKHRKNSLPIQGLKVFISWAGAELHICRCRLPSFSNSDPCSTETKPYVKIKPPHKLIPHRILNGSQLNLTFVVRHAWSWVRNPTNVWIHYLQEHGSKKFGCHFGCQENRRCCTRSESEESIVRRWESTQARDPPWLWNLGQMSNVGVSVVPSKVFMSSNFFFKNQLLTGHPRKHDIYVVAVCNHLYGD